MKHLKTNYHFILLSYSIKSKKSIRTLENIMVNLKSCINLIEFTLFWLCLNFLVIKEMKRFLQCMVLRLYYEIRRLWFLHGQRSKFTKSIK